MSSILQRKSSEQVACRWCDRPAATFHQRLGIPACEFHEDDDSPPPGSRYRTGEVTKNWVNGVRQSPGLLAEDAAEVMGLAAAEGYRFIGSAVATAYHPAGHIMTETCLLFFEREDS